MKGIEEEYNAKSTEYQPIFLSSAAVSAAKDSHPRPTSRLVSGSCMAIRIFWKNLAETTRARAVRAVAFKKCCLKNGTYDGERRNHFLQRIGFSRTRHQRFDRAAPSPPYPATEVHSWPPPDCPLPLSVTLKSEFRSSGRPPGFRPSRSRQMR